MPDLLSLPEDLLSKISHFVHPHNLIDWACISNILSRCSLRPCKKYRQRRSDLRVVHDRNPITIPSLLRSGLFEPEILWYVRSLDIWDLRENFEEWKSSRLSNMNPIWVCESDEFLSWPEKHHDYSHLDTTFYADEELERYRNIPSDLLHLKGPLVDRWMERLRTGSDESPKVLLMAMSPRLKKAAFVEYDCWQSGRKTHPFRLLASTLRRLPSVGDPQRFVRPIKNVFDDTLSEAVGYLDTRRPRESLVLLPNRCKNLLLYSSGSLLMKKTPPKSPDPKDQVLRKRETAPFLPTSSKLSVKALQRVFCTSKRQSNNASKLYDSTLRYNELIISNNLTKRGAAIEVTTTTFSWPWKPCSRKTPCSI